MDVTGIPFNRLIDILQPAGEDRALRLDFRDDLKNHLGTLHGSAQFALAEACSGLTLHRCFPHLTDSVLPVLRKSDVKFRSPARSAVQARGDIDVETKERFERQFERKGRAGISVSVDLTDQDGTVTMSGTFEWFVQRLDESTPTD
jgi:acyl-coenzyme A thioesterase PaaI-like protein